MGKPKDSAVVAKPAPSVGWKGVKNMDLATWNAMRVRALQENPPMEMAEFIKKLFDYYVVNNF